jgi:hypothetical protein
MTAMLGPLLGRSRCSPSSLATLGGTVGSA